MKKIFNKVFDINRFYTISIITMASVVVLINTSYIIKIIFISVALVCVLIEIINITKKDY